MTPNTRSSRSGRIGPVYIRAVSNTGARPWPLRERDRLAVDLRHVEKDVAAAGGRDQRREHRLRRRAIVGHQRADLPTRAARTDHAPGGELAVTHQRAADMAGRVDPRAQERRTRRGENRGVVRLHGAKDTSRSG